MNTSNDETVQKWEYPAEIKNVELVCADVKKIFEKHGLIRKERFALEILLREALNNAVSHGCRLNPQLKFRCTVEVTPRRAVIEVSDDGPGFNWRKEAPTPYENYGEGGRGRQIYSLYAHAVKYNDSGNSIRLTRSFV